MEGLTLPMLVALGEKGVPAFPGDAQDLPWREFHPVGSPRHLGRHTLLAFDRWESD